MIKSLIASLATFFGALLVAQITNLYFISIGRYELNSQFFFGLAGDNRAAILISFLTLLLLAGLFTGLTQNIIVRACRELLHPRSTEESKNKFASPVFLMLGSHPSIPAFSLVLAGASSNIIDRFARGGVIDYFSLPYVPLFNVADIFITVGAIILVIGTLRKPENKP